jgi:iron-sulfur cluster insertion protein
MINTIMITISNSARLKIKDLLYEEGNPKLALRTFVQGGGCSGFSYGFTFDDVTNEDDFEIPLDEFKVLVDAMSMQYLQGAEIDYKDELMGSSFTITNPNATTTCGCGSSFSVADDYVDHLEV